MLPNCAGTSSPLKSDNEDDSSVASSGENLGRAWKIPTQRIRIALSKTKESKGGRRGEERRAVGGQRIKCVPFESVIYCGMSI